MKNEWNEDIQNKDGVRRRHQDAKAIPLGHRPGKRWAESASPPHSSSPNLTSLPGYSWPCQGAFLLPCLGPVWGPTTHVPTVLTLTTGKKDWSLNFGVLMCHFQSNQVLMLIRIFLTYDKCRHLERAWPNCYHSLQTAFQKQDFHLNFLRLGLPPFLIFKKRKTSLWIQISSGWVLLLSKMSKTHAFVSHEIPDHSNVHFFVMAIKCK